MKILHLADLHLGRSLSNYSLLEDQRYILEQILQLINTNTPDAVIIAGDIYDKAVPSAEAVNVFDWFLTALCSRNLPVLLIAGNHDSGERLGFAAGILRPQQVYIAGAFTGVAQKVTLQDAAGDINFYLLPYIKPAQVRHFYPEQEIQTYTQAVQVALQASGIDTAARNVLVAHQFVAGKGETPMLSDSEIHPVGGSDCVDAAALQGFCYVALGHLHGPHHTGCETIRYAGSPLKYSLSEESHKKTVCMVTLDAAGKAQYTMHPLQPMRDVRSIKGPIAALTSAEVLASAPPFDYVYATLTDENEVVNARDKLAAVYPNLLGMAYDNTRQRAAQALQIPKLRQKSPYELFLDFYVERNGQPPDEAQQKLIVAELERVMEAE